MGQAESLELALYFALDVWTREQREINRQAALEYLKERVDGRADRGAGMSYTVQEIIERIDDGIAALERIAKAMESIAMKYGSPDDLED